MIDIAILRQDPERVKENMKKKFQDEKLHIVDEVLDIDVEYREAVTRASEIRSQRNTLSKEIGLFMRNGEKDKAEENKRKVNSMADELAELEVKETELGAKLKELMMQIPNFIDDTVPIGKDDSENVEIEKFGEPALKDFDVPYHTQIMEALNGIDMDSAG